jgi:hypothetical protein
LGLVSEEVPMNVLLPLLAALIFLPVKAYASPEVSPFLTNKFNLRIGLFLPNKDYSVRVDGSVPNTVIDFDDTFKFDESETIGSLNLRWRFGEKWSV